ncbi:MAG: alkaline phosphatase family protein [Myxococcota bacterium]|nr:alkaline phosphatase family protein [Myxococcota bacterium]
MLPRPENALVALLLICMLPALESSALESASTPPGRVILIALDGVRWQDFFDLPASRIRSDTQKPAPFAGYHSILAEEGIVFGNRSEGSRVRMTLSGFFSKRKSLPSYQAILAGFAQPCPDNNCPRIGVETLPESVARRRKLAPEKVAVIASWPGLARAAARNPEAIHLDAGEIQNQGERAGEWGTREDEKTVQIALEHFNEHSPEFLFVVLDSADHAGHAGDKADYVDALRWYDKILMDFIETIEAMPKAERERTTLIVTTDHGRGSWGDFWKFHSVIYSAQDVFIAATGPHVMRGSTHSTGETRTLYHADLRPTIEILLGLRPTECTHSTCGREIPQLIPSDPQGSTATGPNSFREP